MNMNPVVRRDGREKVRRGEWDRGLNGSHSFPQFFLWAVFSACET